jgi:hypothetical protein
MKSADRWLGDYDDDDDDDDDDGMAEGIPEMHP